MPNDPEETTHGADSPAREPVRRYIVASTHEGVLALYTAITGKESTEEDKARLRDRMTKHPLPPIKG